MKNKKGFATFSSLEEGKEALKNDLRIKFNRGMSVKEILEIWCEGDCGYEKAIYRLSEQRYLSQ